jgi:hypothetical protein
MGEFYKLSFFIGRFIMWSERLRQLSKYQFEYGGCNVKNGKGQFGFLISNIANNEFKIALLDSNEVINFSSIFDLLNAEWVVD